MSYHIVKHIDIDKKEGKVYITGSDNNVIPRTPHRWHCTYYDDLMREKRYNDVDLDILGAYESGNFQAGAQNKFTRALLALQHMPEYLDFSWRDNWDHYKENREKRKDEWQALLQKALKTKLPGKKWAITTKKYGHHLGKDVQVYGRYRKNGNRMNWYAEKDKATLKRFKEDAEAVKKYFYNSDDWEVVNIKK